MVKTGRRQLLTPLIWLSLRSARQGLSIEGETEGMEDTDATSSGGFEDRADIGVEVGAPSGSEAGGDLAEDDAGPQRLFGASACSEPLLVGETARSVRKTNRFWRKRLMMRCSFRPALVGGSSLSSWARDRWGRA